MNEPVKLSIIMPCFNVGETFERAIESVICQRVSFHYEIIIVDDCSSDNGPEIFKRYMEKYEFVKVIRHETNMGNAMSFYDGLSAAQGDYYCVIDGDDYYTIRDKLQKQVDFLDADVTYEYAGVAHYFIVDLGDGMVNIPDQNKVTEYNYVDFMTQNAGYYHTTTNMYRNIFHGNVPEQFKSDAFRGDTARTAFQLMYSNKKIKVLNFVGSAYVFTQQGIWSGINEKQQMQRQINLWSDIRDFSTSEAEKRFYNKLADTWKGKLKTATDDYRKYPGISIETALGQVRQNAGRLAFCDVERGFIFNGAYFSEFADSLCATLGYVYRVYHPEYVQTKADPDSLCIIIGLLNPQGGGIFREINEIINMYPDKQITLISVIVGEHDEMARELLSKYSNLRLITAPKECSDRLGYLSKVYLEILPSKAYYYTSHNDPFSMALMQTGPCRNDVLFSFDHGYLLGISNPNIDCIIAKRPSDFDMLRRKFGEKVIYIPTWNESVEIPKNLQYQPFKGHDRLITACAAARFYKVDGKGPHVYLDMVLELLEHTHGRHFHMGLIPDEKLEYVRNYMREHAIPDESFVYIPWADNPAVTALNNHVDIFIEPFPTVSYKLTLGMLSCGIPVFVQDDIRRINKVDFIYDDCLTWRSKEEFMNKLTSLTAEELEDHSRRSLYYFNSWHSVDVVLPHFREDKSFTIPKSVGIADNTIHEIREYLGLFGSEARTLYVRMNQPGLDTAPKRRTMANTKSAEIFTPYVPGTQVESSEPWLYRKFRGLICCYKEHGAKYTLWRIKVHLTGNERMATGSTRPWQRFKNLLKFILPPPLRTFNREVERILTTNEALKQEIKSLKYELIESNKKNTKQITKEVLEEHKKLVAQLRTSKEQFKYTQSLQYRAINETLWANIYNNTIRNSKWLVDKTVSPGRWAVGYPGLYAIYCILDRMQPKRILELGYGQSTRLISQYAKANEQVEHFVVEHDSNWIEFFSKNMESLTNTRIVKLDTDRITYHEAENVLVFSGFEEKFSKLQFDFIIIDAPFGTAPDNSKKIMSRVDVLQILPMCLEKSFVIVLDDFERQGERTTAAEIDVILKESGIECKTGNYSGSKDTKIWCSPDLSFLCSL